MKSFLILLIAILCTLQWAYSQTSKYLRTIEQINSCSPSGTDTAAAFYRHMIDGYADKVNVAF